MELDGKTAVVTGASSGFGAATVRKLREAGVRVVGGARRVERIDADVALPLDVTDEESCAAFVARAAAELGGIDILYNNAGLALGRYPFTESTPEDEATVLHTNVDGAIRVTRLALPHVRDEGHILFTARSPGARRTRMPLSTSLQSSLSVASSTACGRTSSAVRYASRPSIRGSRRPSSRSCASRATPRPRRRRTERRAADRGRRRRLRPLRSHSPAACERGRDRDQGSRPVERRPDRSQRRLGACSRSSRDPRSASRTTAVTSPRRRAASSRTTRASSPGSC